MEDFWPRTQAARALAGKRCVPQDSHPAGRVGAMNRPFRRSHRFRPASVPRVRGQAARRSCVNSASVGMAQFALLPRRPTAMNTGPWPSRSARSTTGRQAAFCGSNFKIASAAATRTRSSESLSAGTSADAAPSASGSPATVRIAARRTLGSGSPSCVRHWSSPPRQPAIASSGKRMAKRDVLLILTVGRFLAGACRQRDVHVGFDRIFEKPHGAIAE